VNFENFGISNFNTVRLVHKPLEYDTLVQNYATKMNFRPLSNINALLVNFENFGHTIKNKLFCLVKLLADLSTIF